MSVNKTEIAFLKGGGEMGELIRMHAWEKTSLGPANEWPQSLRTTISIILNSKFPMFLFWGPELICFYNDAYRPSLGNDGKHPLILGGRGEDAWGEIWAFIKPLIDQVIAGGEASWNEDQLLPIYRNGKMEDVYWTFSYSPVSDETGKPAGVFVTCTETTEKVNNLKKLSDSRNELSFAIEATGLGTFDYNPATGRFSANQKLKTWFGLEPTEEVELSHAIESMAPEDRERVAEAITNALDPEKGGRYDIIYKIIHPKTKKETFVHAKGMTWFNEKREAYRFNGTLEDITLEFQARKTLFEKEQELAESERNLRSIILQAPFAIAIFRTKNHAVEMVNDRALELWGRTRSEVIGKPILQGIPELKDQHLQEFLDNVYNTGEVFVGTELPILLKKNGQLQTVYVNFTIEPLYDVDRSINGIMTVGVEVTEQVLSRQKLENLIIEQQASEQRLNVVIEASELGNWELNLKTDEVRYSERYREIFGYAIDDEPDHDEMLNDLHPEDRIGRDQALQKSYETSRLYYESRIIWKDKSIHWIEVQGKVFFDESGKPEKLIGTLRDITDSKRHEAEILESEQKFRLLADSMPQFVWTGDARGELNYFNRAVYEYSGLSEKQVSEEGWLQIVHPEEREKNISEWIKSVETGSDFIFEHRFLRHDNVYRWQLSRAIPQRNSAGEIQMWVGTSTDIENQKSFSDELERKVKERTDELALKNTALENSNKELQSFTYISSHDLQEPLRKILIFSDLLHETDRTVLSEDGKNSLDRIIYSAKRMRKLIDDLLAYSKISSETLNEEQVDIQDIFNEVKNDLQEAIKEKNAVIDIQGDVTIKALRFQFEQLFMNLLSNALKFSSPERQPKITISSKYISAGVEISVQDNGIGFDPKYNKRIFELFQKLHGSTEYSGTGIGLAIVKKIVENHQGKIEGFGNVGAGALFVMRFPQG